MPQIPRPALRCAAGTAVFVLGLSVNAWSQVRLPAFSKEGGVAAVTFMPGFTFDGVTFDGATAYKEVDGEELLFLPRLDTQPLIRGMLGFRGRSASFEVSYERTRHDGSFGDFPLNAVFQAINLDGRYFFLPTSRVQPHVLVGAAFPWFRVREGSWLDPDLGDARFRGYGVNTEAGVTIFPHRQFGVGVGYSYRVFWFDRASGATDRLFELRPRFRETSGSLALTGTMIF